jgi:hypothetical protein
MRQDGSPLSRIDAVPTVFPRAPPAARLSCCFTIVHRFVVARISARASRAHEGGHTMFRICALTVAGFTVMALGAGVASPASMKSNSTGTIGGDWDIDTDQLSTERQDRGSLDSQFFHVDWAAKAEGAGQTEITGRVHDDYGQPATNVELRIAMVDATGHEVQSVIRPVQGLIPAKGDAYFDVHVPDSSAYRISVESFDFVESAGQ